MEVPIDKLLLWVVTKMLITYMSQNIQFKYNIIIWTKLVMLTCRDIIGIFAIFWVGCWYWILVCYCQNGHFLITNVRVGTLLSLCVHDVMVMCGEFMANYESLSKQKEFWGAIHIFVLLAIRRNDVYYASMSWELHCFHLPQNHLILQFHSYMISSWILIWQAGDHS